ncbi:MAG: hypothetical protein DCF32_10280 [Leptolyngbya sp.]|nr:MAG: hypothetical protein DCF32_10280 [Leptolyngbya sp.]
MPIDIKHFHFYLDHESDSYRSRGEFNDHGCEFDEQADELNQQADGFKQRLDFGLDHDDALAQAEGEFKPQQAGFEVWEAIAAFNLSAHHQGDGHGLCPLPILRIARNTDNFSFGHRVHQRA